MLSFRSHRTRMYVCPSVFFNGLFGNNFFKKQKLHDEPVIMVYYHFGISKQRLR